MTAIATLILAFSLSVDSLVVAASCSLATPIDRRRGNTMASLFALFQGGLPLLGALVGAAMKEPLAAVDHWIAFALLVGIGLKMIVEGFRDAKEKPFDVSRIGVVCTLALATSIDALVVGIGFGLTYSTAQLLTTVVVIALVTFLATWFGIVLGRRRTHLSPQWAGILSGAVLIALAIHTLHEHDVF
ncbi:MAG: manganese efflux pump [Bacteroidales bacterium]|nr:manganese efflux pump [Bacteroidales bacterium]